MYKKLVFSLSLIAAFPFCYTMEPNEVAMQLTDVEGTIFTLNKEQLEAFKQCAIYSDYQDNIAKDETAENDIPNQSKIWSFSDCTTSELKADNICKLMDFINYGNCIIRKKGNYFIAITPALKKEEYAPLFALSLYMGVPKHKIQKLANMYFDVYGSMCIEQDNPNIYYSQLYKIAYKYKCGEKIG